MMSSHKILIMVIYTPASVAIANAERVVTRAQTRNSPVRTAHAVVPSVQNDDDDPFAVDLAEYLLELDQMQELIDRSDIGGCKVMDASGISRQHARLKDTILISFITTLEGIFESPYCYFSKVNASFLSWSHF